MKSLLTHQLDIFSLIERKESQLERVYTVLKTGRWYSLAELAFHCQAPEASVSARIRELSRKGFPHAKRKAKDGSVFEYQLIS